ncbi:hypothetical protein HBH44_084640 [Parastagonospora nodorum]|nr:hypothetical protein HBH45_109270 [Parastagonospora nodorum]KAH4163589.1 hypothetical protein HBH44_084640 [Parastagonospora nodorum]KAH4640479.1 hypothetical protein HBH81_092090 [Parastagonospora nodorum]
MLAKVRYIVLLTKLAILNNANVTLVDAVHYSVVKQFSMFRLMTKEIIDALTMTLIKDDDDLLGTVNSHIKPPLKRCKTEAADSRYAKASRERTKKDKDLEDSNTSSNVLRLRRRDRAAASQLKKTRDEEKLAKAKKEKEKKENERQSLCKSKNSNRILHSRRLTDAYILYFKELLSNNSGIFANAIGIGKTQAIVLAVLIEHCNLSDPLALQFCFFSNSPLENISRLTKEEAIEMQINTTNAISKALAAANKLIILEANTPTMHSKAIKHRLALSAAQFIIVCSFRKVDKYIFRAYNTISVTAQRTIIRKSSLYIEKRAILLPSYFNATNKRDSVTSDRIYKIEDAVYQDILEKEGLNKLEASRRVIFNCFKMQAIAFYSALATLKAAQFKTYSSCKVKRFTLNSVKDLFTNLSKDYFLVREARAITKSSLKFQNLSNLCSKLGLREKFSNESVLVMQRGITQHEINLKLIIVALIAFAEVIILTEATHVVIIELQDRQNTQDQFIIVYFNLDSKLELKVLGKQDVKTTS